MMLRQLLPLMLLLLHHPAVVPPGCLRTFTAREEAAVAAVMDLRLGRHNIGMLLPLDGVTSCGGGSTHVAAAVAAGGAAAVAAAAAADG